MSRKACGSLIPQMDVGNTRQIRTIPTEILRNLLIYMELDLLHPEQTYNTS